MPLSLLALMVAAQPGGPASPLTPALRSRLTAAIPKGRKNAIVPGQVLVKLRPALAEGLVQVRDAAAIGADVVPGGQIVSRIGASGWTLWRIPIGSDPRAVAALVKTRPGVLAAEPVNRVYPMLAQPNDADWNVEETSEDLILYFGEDEPYTFRRLWHLDDTNAFAGWNVWPNQYYTAANKPNTAPLVAVIDTGCDMDHPDFANAGGLSTDSAQGGQLDKSLSATFELGEQVPGASQEDLNGHGTHVAGLALASANNGGYDGHGVLGTGYACRGMILRVFDDQGTGTDADAAAAMFYAADHGAAVISISLGTENFSQLFQDAVTYATQKGSLVVASGNEDGGGGGDLGPIYPAACSGALAVTANGPNGIPATGTYSGTGSYLDLAAPGGDLLQDTEQLTIQFVFSTAVRGFSSLSQNPVLYPPYTPEYSYLAGTSMATPLVSGAAGLYYGKNGFAQTTGWANRQTYRALELSAASGATALNNGGWEPSQGYGCLDIESALLDYPARGATVGAIKGIVYYNGTAFQNATVRAKKTNGTGVNYSTTTRPDGTFRFESLPPGTYTVTTAPFGAVKSKNATVKAGSDQAGFELWCGTYFPDDTPPTVGKFQWVSNTATSATIRHWAYDTETGIDRMTFRAGRRAEGAEYLPETEVFPEGELVTVPLTKLPTFYNFQARYTNGANVVTTINRAVIAMQEDAYVRDGASANANFGAAQEVIVRNTALSGYSRKGYLKLDTSSVLGNVTNVKLRFAAARWAGDFATAPIQFFPTSNGWSQSTITWSNAPAATGAALASVTVNSPTYVPTYYEIDLTAYVLAQRALGNKVVSLLVASPTRTDGLEIYSRESSWVPQVIVTSQS